MSEIRDHRDLEAWQVAMDAVTETYKLTASFPRSELYGLTSQMRRAAVSAPSNIAEGQGRGDAIRACLNYFGIALGSLAELDTQLEVAIRLAYVTVADTRDLKQLIESSRRLVHGLRRAKQRRLVGTATGALFVFALLRLFS
jgi:four helix bundle protein